MTNMCIIEGENYRVLRSGTYYKGRKIGNRADPSIGLYKYREVKKGTAFPKEYYYPDTPLYYVEGDTVVKVTGHVFKSLSQVKEVVRSKISQRKKDILFGGISVRGKVLQTSADSQTFLLDEIEHSTEEKVSWRMGDNSFETFTKEELSDLGLAVRTHRSSCLSAQEDLESVLDKMKTCEGALSVLDQMERTYLANI